MLQNATSPTVASPSPIDPYAQDRIAYHARRLSRKPGFTISDVPDLEQELAMDLLKALPKFDPSKASLPTFISRVVNRRCLGLLRDARHPKRRGDTSLDAAMGDEVAQDQRHRMTGHRPADGVEKAEVAEVVQLAVGKLPDRLHKIAVLLMSHTQAEAARELGVSETTIHRARKQIREHFKEAGVPELLQKG
jgi:RNA polymerase sigma factor (sigma-70 family)